jgi:NAD(P)H-nitrite reductase large subunit
MNDVVIVNHCECKGRTFAQLKEYGNFYAAMGATGCGAECGSCIPFIKLMFATGETEFKSDDPRLDQYRPTPVEYDPGFF